jgi:hypothetical protein
MVEGRLIGTTLGEINQPLRSLSIENGILRLELPNWQPWGFAGAFTERRHNRRCREQLAGGLAGDLQTHVGTMTYKGEYVV